MYVRLCAEISSAFSASRFALCRRRTKYTASPQTTNIATTAREMPSARAVALLDCAGETVEEAEAVALVAVVDMVRRE